MRILVVAPSWIGDTLMMQPLLMRLKAQRPDNEIHVLAPAWGSPLLARMPEVAAVIENPFGHGEFNWAGRKALARRIDKADFSRAYVLPNSWKSALVPFLAGIPQRIGYTGEARYLLLNERHRLDAAALPRLVDRYAALAGPIARPRSDPHADPRSENVQRPRLTSTPEQQRAARAALDLPVDASPVVFCPGAEYGPAKRWPAHHFADLARMLAQKLGVGEAATSPSTASMGTPVWLIGSHKDAAVGDEIVRLAAGHAINLCGRTSLEQAIDLIAGARHVVSNDSGLMHVAAALDRPLIALYGSSSPGYTPPLSPRSTILSLGLGCSPCFKRECPLDPPRHMRCLEDLGPERVFDSLTDCSPADNA